VAPNECDKEGTSLKRIVIFSAVAKDIYWFYDRTLKTFLVFMTSR